MIDASEAIARINVNNHSGTCFRTTHGLATAKHVVCRNPSDKDQTMTVSTQQGAIMTLSGPQPTNSTLDGIAIISSTPELNAHLTSSLNPGVLTPDDIIAIVTLH